MFQLKVGERYQEIKGVGEGVKFSFTDAGAEMLILFNKPTAKEIEDIKTGKLQFGMFVNEGIIFILSKFGSMPWMDAPFHVALAKNLNTLQDIGEGQGYGCNIILADSSTGEVKVLRYVSFSTDFSRKLKKNIEAQIRDDFNASEYDAKLNLIMRNYSTKDMVRFSESNCRIK